MKTQRKLLTALKSASAFVDDSLHCLAEAEDALIARKVWYVAVELEYALFLFSMILGDESVGVRRKLMRAPKLVKIDDTLRLTRSLLEKSGELTSRNQLLDAYTEASIARSHVLTLQKYYRKKKRERTRRS
jgi:hypothetical protein